MTKRGTYEGITSNNTVTAEYSQFRYIWYINDRL